MELPPWLRVVKNTQLEELSPGSGAVFLPEFLETLESILLHKGPALPKPGISVSSKLFLILLLACAALEASLGGEAHPNNEDGLIEGSELNYTLTKCFAYADMQILVTPMKEEGGNEIYVEANPAQKCAISARAWKVTDEKTANYFIGKWRNVLLINENTGPRRKLRLYDAAANKQIFFGFYGEPIHLSGSVLTVWLAIKKKMDVTNCPEFGKVEKQRLTPAFEAETKLDLAKQPIEPAPTEALRCVVHQ